MAATSLTSPTQASPISRFLIPDLPSAGEVFPYLRRIDEERWYTNFGPLVREFEEQLQSLLTRVDRTPAHGPIHLTTVASGHYALEIALHLLGITHRKKVLLPAVTFPACPLAAQHNAAEVILSDIDPITWTLTPEIARAVAARTQIDAVMPVALYGTPMPISPWDEFTRDTGIPVVIDAAAAVEVQQLPRFGFVAHSLHATKPFGIGEGGVLASRDASLIEMARRYTNFGTSERICYTDGSNTKLSEYHAAVALAQLNRWTEIKRRRRELLNLYREYLAPFTDFFSLQAGLETAVVSLFVLMLQNRRADSVLSELARRGISTHRSYLPPLYRHPYFTNLSVSDVQGNILPPEAVVEQKRLHMVNSESLLAHLVGLPFHPFLAESDVVTVVREIGRHFDNTGRLG